LGAFIAASVSQRNRMAFRAFPAFAVPGLWRFAGFPLEPACSLPSGGGKGLDWQAF
jgi:hypothetical protein